MRKIRYGVAMSLDGYIAGPNGEADWILSDPGINFAELWSQFDAFLMGRRTYQAAVSRLGAATFAGRKTVVVSRTLRQVEHPEITVISELKKEAIDDLRQEGKKDIWLMGGGELFRSLLQVREVDLVEVLVMPVLLGGGIALLPPSPDRTQLKLTGDKAYASGVVSLIYEVLK